MHPLPPDAVLYKRTPTFTEDTVPAGLLRAHRTKPGVWGQIVVESGRLRCWLEDGSGQAWVLDPETPGVMAPEALHAVAPEGAVRFHVAFWRREADGD